MVCTYGEVGRVDLSSFGPCDVALSVEQNGAKIASCSFAMKKAKNERQRGPLSIAGSPGTRTYYATR